MLLHSVCEYIEMAGENCNCLGRVHFTFIIEYDAKNVWKTIGNHVEKGNKQTNRQRNNNMEINMIAYWVLNLMKIGCQCAEILNGKFQLNADVRSVSSVFLSTCDLCSLLVGGTMN